jgi:methylenetetrahydrofolate dehydrogenase (NADP+)/methenyltetrahydrofolate cyclohydrolase
MTAQIIDGNAVSAALREGLALRIARLKADGGPTPGLAVVLVGSDPASQVYVKSKHKRATEIGMNSFEHFLPEDTSEAALLALVDQLNQDPSVHGILVQLPLPKQIDAERVLERIDPAKDVDGFHPVNVGRLATGGPALVSCTPLGCLILLKRTLGDLAGKRAVVVGRSNIVGKPMAQLLLRDSATVVIAHSNTLEACCRQHGLPFAEIL